MKTRVICAMAAAVLAFSLTSCSSKEPESTVSVTSAVELKGLQDKEHSVYNGKLNGQPVCMEIYRDGNSLTASYINKNSTEETSLTGTYTDGSITLTQEGKNIKITGSMVKDNLLSLSAGDNEENSTSMYQLHHVVKSNSAQIRYPGFDNNEVESFAESIKKYISADDKDNLSKLMAYPLTVRLNSGETTINDEKEFKKQYDKILSESVKKGVSNAYTKFMSCNEKGVALTGGTGYIRINKAEDGSLKIITIVN